MDQAEALQEQEQTSVDTATAHSPIPEQEAAAIRRIMAKLRPNDPLRQAADTVLVTGVLPAEAMEAVLSCLQTPHPYRWRRQHLAAGLLGCVQGEGKARETICACLSEIVARWPVRCAGHRTLRAAGPALILSAGIVLGLISISPITGSFAGALFALLVLGGIIWAAMLPPLSIIENNKIAYTRASALIALGRLRSVENLAIIAEACLESSSAWNTSLHMNGLQLTRSYAAWALRVTLPHVQRSDYGRLSPATIPNLCAVLKAASKTQTIPDKSMMVQILRTLAKIGDERALAPVEWLAKHSASDMVRRTAAEALPILQVRRQQEQAAKTLLRASETNGSPPDILLRAAVAVSNQMDTEELLRAEEAANRA